MGVAFPLCKVGWKLLPHGACRNYVDAGTGTAILKTCDCVMGVRTLGRGRKMGGRGGGLVSGVHGLRAMRQH